MRAGTRTVGAVPADASAATRRGGVRHMLCTINTQQYFERVAAATRGFRVGGEQVRDKWIKDRKGRALRFTDLLHYQRVVVALAETQRLMAAIDVRIGAWPFG